MLLDLAQGGYLDLQRIDPFQCEAHSAAHELSYPATLLEQHLQPAVLPSVRLHPANSLQDDTVGRRETMRGFSQSSRACARDEKLVYPRNKLDK